MTYPNGTRFNDWTICNETRAGTRVPTVRRWVLYPDGRKTFERYPVKKYQDLRATPDALRDYVIRLNHRLPEEQRTRAKIEIRHAFITQETVDQYLVHLRSEIPDGKDALVCWGYVHRHFLQFFIHRMEIPDPIQWHRNQAAWAHALLNEFPKDYKTRQVERLRLWPADRLPAPATIRHIIQHTNRFMKWLHQQRPDFVPPLEFAPISRAQLKKLGARRELKGVVRTKWFIPSEDWARIERQLAGPFSDIRPLCNLAYGFGLRLSETGGLELADVRRDFMAVDRQLVAIPDGERVTDVLKGRAKRKVPYWYSNPKQAYGWISDAALMNPNTLATRWGDLMETLSLPYTFHDIRRTWITRCFRVGPEVLPTDIQLAAGHVNIETTMKYKLDDRQLDDDVWMPDDDT